MKLKLSSYGFLLLLINFTIADWSYQENANSTYCSGNWDVLYPCSNTYDSNWTTWGQAEALLTAEVQFNYTKPLGATSASLWQIKDYENGAETTVNLSIDSNCWKQSTLQFLVASSAEVGNTYTHWKCYNGSSWITLRSITNYARIYEEAMYWNIGCQVISAPGSYQLSSNVEGAPNTVGGVPDITRACVAITSSDVEFSCAGYNITNNGTADAAGIIINGSTTINFTNVTIRDCPAVAGYEKGFYIHRSSGDSILNSTTFSNTEYGVYLYYDGMNSISNCSSFNNSYRGFYLYSSSNNNITNNTAYNNPHFGFYDYLGSNNIFNSNNAYQNSVHGFHIRSTSNNTITNNNAYNNSYNGFYLYSSSNNNITNNSAYNNSNSGFYLLSSSNNNVLTNNTVFNNSLYGIVVNGVNNTIERNDMYDQGEACIYLNVSNSTLIKNNTIHDSSIDGLQTDQGSSNFGTIIEYNNFSSLWIAIDFNGGSTNNSIIRHNILNGSSYAIYIVDENEKNTFYDNAIYGAVMDQNLFGNFWNTTKTLGTNIIGGPYIGGNYYSDYTGVDTDGDGIGETPYAIYDDGGEPTLTGYDYLPLTNNTNLAITLVNITSIAGHQNNTIIDDTTPNVEFYVIDVDNATLSCTLYIDGTTNSGTNETVENNTLTNITTDWNLSYGTWYNFSVNCTDGYSEVASEEWRMFIGSAPDTPNVSIEADRIPEIAPTNLTCRVNVSDIIGAGMNVSIFWHDNGVLVDAYNATYIGVANGTTVNDTVNYTEGLTYGHNYTCHAIATNIVGSSGQGNSTILYINYSIPSLTIDSPTNTTMSYLQNMTINFTLLDNNSNTYNCSFYINNNYNDSGTYTNGTSTWAINVAEGVYNFSMNCTDNVYVLNSSQYNITIDRTAPSVSITPEGYTTLDNDEVDMIITFNDALSPVTVFLTIDTTTFTPTSCSGATNTCSYNHTYSSGTYLYNATVIDFAGNVNYTSTYMLTINGMGQLPSEGGGGGGGLPSNSSPTETENLTLDSETIQNISEYNEEFLASFLEGVESQGTGLVLTIEETLEKIRESSLCFPLIIIITVTTIIYYVWKRKRDDKYDN